MIEHGDREVETEILTEVILQLLAASVGVKSRRLVIVGAQASRERERRHIVGTGYLDIEVGSLQAQLLSLNLWFHTESLGIYNIWSHNTALIAIQRSNGRDIGLDDDKALGRWQFEQLRQCQEREAIVVVGISGRETALRECCFLLRHLSLTGLTRLHHPLKPIHLHGVDGNLSLGNIAHLHRGSGDRSLIRLHRYANVH